MAICCCTWYTHTHTHTSTGHIIVSYVYSVWKDHYYCCAIHLMISNHFQASRTQCNVSSVYERFEILRVLLTSVISISSTLRANRTLIAITQLFKSQSPLRFVISYIGSNLISLSLPLYLSLRVCLCLYFTFSHTLCPNLSHVFAVRFGFTSNQLKFIAEEVAIQSAIVYSYTTHGQRTHLVPCIECIGIHHFLYCNRFGFYCRCDYNHTINVRNIPPERSARNGCHFSD